LWHKDQVLSEISAVHVTSEIEIGRSSSCAWRVPPEDALISKHHAVLTRQGRTVLLRDKGSSNGTWFQGGQVVERLLQAGDRLTLGHCVLTVEQEDGETGAGAAAELEVVTGNQRKRRKLIEADRLRIGAAPDSDLLLTDEAVSRNHAVVFRKGKDSYWLKALKTTNGTTVNDLPLRPEQEQLLKDGDRIVLADVEMLFHDGSRRRGDGEGLRQLAVKAVKAVMAVAGAAVAALCFGWLLTRR
jgi:pSer/pThr/pTyr-binding forkhead associated (FHA) protein